MSVPVVRPGWELIDYPLHESSRRVLDSFRQMDGLRGSHRNFVVEGRGAPIYAFTRQADILRVLQDPATFSSHSTPDGGEVAFELIPQTVDPPEHGRWRKLMGPLFAPGEVARHREHVTRTCVDLIEGFAGRGRCELNVDFVKRFPATVFLDLMGLPVDGLDEFMVWEEAILHGNEANDPDGSRQLAAMGEVTAYFTEVIARLRSQPDPGNSKIINRALSWETDGRPIDDGELLSFCLLMFMAGLDTVTAQLGYAFYHLATHESDRRRLVADPSLCASAVEELLRVYPIVQLHRKVTADVEVGGCPLRAGDTLFLPLAAAGRDDEAREDAGRVLLDRSPNRHISFGAGPHRCLGSHLARLEMVTALREWHARIPDYRVVAGSLPLEESGHMWSLRDLELEW